MRKKKIIKATISNEQAADLIERLGLRAYGQTWRRPQDVRFLAQYHKDREVKTELK